MTTQEFDDSDEGTVIRQVPSAGQEALKASEVTLIISQGPEEPEPQPEPEPTTTVTVVPELVGQSVDDAVAALEEAGLALGDVEEDESDEPAGTVIESNPEAGEEVEQLTAVDLVVSNGGDGDSG